MSDLTSIWLMLGLSCAGVLVSAVMTAGRGMLFYIQAVFLFMAFGPVVSYLLHQPIYFGIVTWRIPDAALGFTLAIATMTLVSVVIRQRRSFSMSAMATRAAGYVAITPLLYCLAAYTTAIMLVRGPQLLGASKPTKIALLGGSLHYTFLLIQLAAMSLFLVVQGSPAMRRAYITNGVAYLSYCLLAAERDFVILAFSIAVHQTVVAGRRINLKLAGGGGVALYLITFLYNQRFGRGVDLNSVLNQGSLLFVDTFVMQHVPLAAPFMSGQTYWYALLNALPVPGVGSSFNLSGWLVGLYAPGSTSGYGFSLTGEAYVNFGMIGVPLAFAAMAIVHLLLLNRIDRHPFYAFMSVFYVTAWAYSFRNDSASLVQSCVVAVGFFGLIHLVSELLPAVRVSNAKSGCARDMVGHLPPSRPTLSPLVSRSRAALRSTRS